MKYIKKPVEIEAVQFLDTTESIEELSDFIGKEIRVDYQDRNNPCLKIETLEGTMKASVGDYIIKGVKGEFYPCKPDIFEATYVPSETPLDRMKIESHGLNERLRKLKSFIDQMDLLNKVLLDEDDKKLLIIQYGNMLAYAHTLDMRIRKMNKNNLLGEL